MKLGRGSKTGMAAGLCLGAALTLAMGFGLGAGAMSRFADPTAVAVVDIDRVSLESQEFKDRVAQIEAGSVARRDELQAISQRLADLDVELGGLTEDQSERRIEIIIDRQIAQSDLQTKTELFRQELDLKQADLTKALYGKILEAAGRVAERDGYDIVLFDDRSITLDDPRAQTFAGAVDLLKQKKVLSAADRVDLTSSVLAMLNNEYAAGE